MFKLSNPSNSNPQKFNLGSFLIWLFAFFVLGEVLIRIGEQASPWFAQVLRGQISIIEKKHFEDETVGITPNPNYPGHDEHGYPNPRGIKQADWVVLGDSQAYGERLDSQEVWPSRAGIIAGKTVYNMSLPGMGPVSYRLNLYPALSFKPKTVFVGIYLGNDLLNAFQSVYEGKLLENFRNRDEKLVNEWMTFEKQASLRSRVQKIQNEMSDRERKIRKSLFHHDSLSEMKNYLFRSMAWYRFLSAFKNNFSPMSSKQQMAERDWNYAKQVAEGNRNIYEIIDDEKLKVVFYPEYRLLALDKNDPRIREGLRLTLEILRDMQDQFSKENVQLIPVLIPTKESAYSKQVFDFKYPVSDKYKALIESESFFRDQIKKFLETTGITCIDLLPALQKTLNSGIHFYPALNDDYPIRETHAVIADAVVEGVKEIAFRQQEKDKAQQGWEFMTRQEPRRDFELKLMVAIAALSFLLILIFTRVRQTIRPILLLSVYVFYLVFQSIFLIEFFPLTAFQMFSFIEEKTVLYDKLIPILQNGKEANVIDYKVLPMLADGRSKRYVEDSFKNPEIANEFASAYAHAYDKRFRKQGEPGIAEIHFERWKWNVFDGPPDSSRGFVVKRVVGKPYEEPHDF